jgi:FkbM family methyltransferase
MNQHTLKGLVARTANRVGYRIERVCDTSESPLDVFDLAVRYLDTIRGERFFFVQVGAFDGVSDDPIHRYIKEFHWTGILVEPQPEAFAKLRANYRGESQLVFENAAIALRDGRTTLHAPSEAHGEAYLTSFDKGVVQKRVGHRVPIREVHVPALTIATLLARHGSPSIDLVQIEAEGFDFEVIKMFDAAGIRPPLIRFEHYHFSRALRQECLAFLAARGYQLHRDRMDMVALHSDVLH